MEQTKPNVFKRMGKSVSNFFKGIGNFFASKFKYMHPLIMMQLKDKLDFTFLKEKKKTFFKIIWQILLFILITAVITILFSLIVKLGLFSNLQILNFRVFLLLMTLIMLFSFISCLVNMTSTLYFAKDNPVLVTFPVKNSEIFASKMIVCFLYELIKNFTYMLPFFIAYGIVMKLSFAYFIWIIFGILFLTILFVALSGFLSIPAMFIAIAFKRHKSLEFIVVGIVAGLLTWGVVSAIFAIPTDIDIVRDWGKFYWQIQDFLESFAIVFLPFDYLLQFLTGMIYDGYIFTPVSLKNFAIFGVCVGIIAFCIIMVILLSRPLFLKMASTSFEYRKNTHVKPHKNKKNRAFSSAVVQNSKRIFRTANLIYSILAVAIITPIAVLLQNKIIGAMDKRLTGDYMGIASNILIILLMMLASNVMLSSLFSREGNSAYLNKVNPVAYYVPLTGKMVLNGLIGCISIIISTCVMVLFSKIRLLHSVLLAISMILIYLGHLLWSAELDIMNPQNRIYQTSGKNDKNPNEAKSTLMAFVISILFSLIALFLMNENIKHVFFKLLAIAIIFFAVRLHLYLLRIKLFYKEKAV